MQVQKLRSANGLVPAGMYFAQLAAKLEEANAREATLRDELDDEDRALEAIYCKHSAARIHALPREHHAMM